MLKVHVLPVIAPRSFAVLSESLSERVSLTYGENSIESAEYEILVGGVLERHHLTDSSALRTVIIPWSGLPKATRPLLVEFSHLAVHNLHHNATATAEMAITLMLSAAKGIVPIDRALRGHDWTPRYEESCSTLLKDKTALVLGYGAIGREIAGMCEGFRMKVLAVRRNEESASENSVETHDVSNLHRLLPEANVLFVCLPFTPETEKLIDGRELSLLPDGAVLVNIARGPIVDERALYEELKIGRIRAGLDVWYNYPKDTTDRSETQPSQYPVHELDNVVMTPHLAGHSENTEDLRIAALAELLNLAAAEKPLPNAVDPKRGY